MLMLMRSLNPIICRIYSFIYLVILYKDTKFLWVSFFIKDKYCFYNLICNHLQIRSSIDDQESPIAMLNKKKSALSKALTLKVCKAQL